MEFRGWKIGRSCLALWSLVALAGLASPASAAELLVNGNFETGTFAGWTTADDNPFGVGGTFFISTPGSPTPVNGFPTAPNPAGGLFYAVSDSDFPGAHVLYQDFVVPAGQSVFLSFQMFVNDQSGLGPIVDPTGLDPTTGGSFRDNQHARVDLMAAGSGPFSTAAGDVIANFYLGVDDVNTIPNPYTSYSFDITPQVSGGGTFRIRFAEVDNDAPLNLGVDNVSIAAAVPEPGTLALFALGALALLARRRTAAMVKPAP